MKINIRENFSYNMDDYVIKKFYNIYDRYCRVFLDSYTPAIPHIKKQQFKGLLHDITILSINTKNTNVVPAPRRGVGIPNPTCVYHNYAWDGYYIYNKLIKHSQGSSSEPWDSYKEKGDNILMWNPYPDGQWFPRVASHFDPGPGTRNKNQNLYDKINHSTTADQKKNNINT